jgi:hypothetical protein
MFQRGFPGITEALSRLMQRYLNPAEPVEKVLVEAVSTTADRLRRIEARLDDLERAEEPM